ncbi:MAG: hypothetical protein Kilf2KO_09740 [Rhodospirillales bacterium]
MLHLASDRAEARARAGVRRVHGLPVGARALGLYGVCDLVEVRQGPTFFPVEYKRGKPKAHRADEVQLCAQALCLEEMTASRVEEGALYYAQTKRRVGVPFDAELRALTERAAAELRALLEAGRTPPPTSRKSRCRACSLKALCRPEAARRGSAAGWVARQLADLAPAAEVR